MNALKTTFRVIAAWLVSHVCASVLLVAASTWLMDPYTSSNERLHIVVAAGAAAFFFSVGSAVLNLLDIRTFKSTLILGGIVSLALVGMGGLDALLRTPLSELLKIVGLIGVPMFGVAFVSSFIFCRVLTKLRR